MHKKYTIPVITQYTQKRRHRVNQIHNWALSLPPKFYALKKMTPQHLFTIQSDTTHTVRNHPIYSTTPI